MTIQNTTQLSTESSQKKPLVKPLYIGIGVVLTLLLTGLFIWGMVALAQNYGSSIEAVRDIFIIVLALESCLFGVVLLILLVMVIRLVNMLEFEIKPILEKTNDTMGTLRGTTQFVSQNVIQPVSRIRIQAAGFTKAIKVLFGNPRNNLKE